MATENRELRDLIEKQNQEISRLKEEMRVHEQTHSELTSALQTIKELQARVAEQEGKQVGATNTNACGSSSFI